MLVSPDECFGLRYRRCPWLGSARPDGRGQTHDDRLGGAYCAVPVVDRPGLLDVPAGTCCTALARSARTAPGPAASFGGPASRPSSPGTPGTRQPLTGKTAPMSHRSGHHRTYVTSGRPLRITLVTRAATASLVRGRRMRRTIRKDGPGISGTWPYFDEAGAGVPGLPPRTGSAAEPGSPR